MKKYFVSAALLVLVACGGGSDTGTTTEKKDAADNAASNDVSSNPDYQKGLDLIGSSDCLTCHKVSEKLVGPAYQDVANKYAGNDTAVSYLANRIISGIGTKEPHNWGSETNNAVMTPHGTLSKQDAEQMVKYILLLKK